MIDDVKKLRKVGELLNSEGTILGVYLNNRREYYLSSFLIKSMGTIYYSSTKEDIEQFINSKIRLKELFLKSNDLIVVNKKRDNQVSYIKEDMSELLWDGNCYFKDFPNGVRNDDFHF